jgi:hypothetical protein
VTHTSKMDDSEGTFGAWRAIDGATCQIERCGAAVSVRLWESNHSGFQDEQYRCEKGHTWWVEGIDS